MAYTKKLLSNKDTFILIMLLATLHVSIWFDFGSLISKSFMLSHLGMFLLWQPVWRGDEKLGIDNTLIFILFTLAFTYWLNSWLLFAWLIILIGFISGRVAADRNERLVLLMALAFLVLQLLFACIPRIARIDIEQGQLFAMLLPLIPVIILFFPISDRQQRVATVDFIHAMTTSMLTALVALGSMLTMFLGESTYFIALTQTTLVIGILILGISWLLTSRTEFSGVIQLWSSYMLNIGTPIENWLTELSRLNEKELSAEEFLDEAMTEMVSFSWISGVGWNLNKEEHEAGVKTEYFVTIDNEHFSVQIYTYNIAGAALKLHCNLLIRLLEDFYTNRMRQNELTKQAHLRAIYETGARITHDIKNLLQSFQAITSLISSDSDNISSTTTQQVLKRQLPGLTQRLQLALDKLQSPQEQAEDKVYLKDWWREFKKRNQLVGVSCEEDLQGDPMIPADLFDSVVDNLLENAHSKMMSGTNVRVVVTLQCNDKLIKLSVCDSGASIPESIVKGLFNGPVKSDNGLGIGLYQASRQAAASGYRLTLLHNQQGRVCFALSS